MYPIGVTDESDLFTEPARLFPVGGRLVRGFAEAAQEAIKKMFEEEE